MSVVPWPSSVNKLAVIIVLFFPQSLISFLAFLA